MRHRFTFLFFLLYLLVVGLLLTVCAEFFLRKLRPDLIAPPEEREKFCIYDKQIGWVNKPLVSGRFQSQDFDVAVYINAERLRDKDYTHTKQPGTFRIGVFGDSYVWGYGVEQAQIFTEILERDIPSIEVLNFGCSGYGQDQELLLLKRSGVLYQLDFVIVNIHEASDFDNNSSYFQYGRYKPLFYGDDTVLTAEGIPVPEETFGTQFNHWLTKRSVAWRIFGNQEILGVPLIARVVAGVDHKGDLLKKMASNLSPDQLTCNLCGEIQRTTASMGSEVLFMLTPDIRIPGKNGRNQLSEPSQNEQKLKTCLRANGAEVLDLRPGFEHYLQENPKRLVTFTHDRHWSVRGHEVAAGIVKEYILQKINFDDSAEL